MISCAYRILHPLACGTRSLVFPLMLALLILVFHVVVSPLKTKARLEAEIIMQRHQLNVLHRPSDSRLDRPPTHGCVPLG